MQKIAIILLMICLFSSCSVTKKRVGNIDRELLSSGETEKGIEDLEKQNITKNNFFIQKAEIELSYQNISKKLIGSIKFEKPDKYLISLKSRTGIEAVRIFISGDTILVNDRINKVLLNAPHDYLQTKYGLSEGLLGILFGDYISDDGSQISKLKCLKGKSDLSADVGGILINYIIDCKLKKIIHVSNDEFSRVGQIEITFNNFTKNGDIFIPGEIVIKDIQTMTTIVIRIKNIEFPWSGKIEFIPGSGYEIKKLL